MISIFCDKFSAISAIDLTPSNEAVLRNELNLLLLQVHNFAAQGLNAEQSAILQHIVQGCHKRLRALQNIIICESTPPRFCLCELREMVDNLCCAGDLVLSGCKRRLIFMAPEGELYSLCSPTQIISLLLNLISNACLHTPAKVIYLRLSKTSSDGAVIEVSSKGYIRLAQLDESGKRQGSGLSAMNSTATSHSGSLLFCNKSNEAHAAFYLPCYEDYYPDEYSLYEHYNSPDFIELLCDRLSPIYTGLCGVCRCPL